MILHKETGVVPSSPTGLWTSTTTRQRIPGTPVSGAPYTPVVHVGVSTPRHRSASTVALVLATLGLCLAVTAVIVAWPRLLLGGHSWSMHVVLDSVDTCVALLAAYLLIGRFRRDASLRSLLLACGLVLLAAGNLAGAVPASRAFTLEVWFPLSLRLLGALLVAAGAVAGQPVVGRRTTSVVAAAVVLAPAAILGALLLAGDALPVALTSAPASAAEPNLTAHAGLIAGHAVGAAAFLLAAVAFTHRAERDRDEMLRWFAPACALGAFSHVHYLLFPSIYSGWLYTGDLLRTGCYLLLLVGAAREISRYWRDQPRLAVVADRKRLARELHDGVAQELTYIVTEGHAIAEPAVRQRITEAAHRGLDDTRAAIDALGFGGQEPLGSRLHRTAGQLTERYGVPVMVLVELDSSVRSTPEQVHALLRIVREAVGNAVRHGGARQVRVRLAGDGRRPLLQIHDDGQGFDPETTPGSGYGITSMRDRAAGLPGVLSIESASGQGTTVEVSWPAS